MFCVAHRLLELADPPQRRSVLLGAGGPAVAALPPQLVTEVLHTVSLCLGAELTLRGGEEEERGEERRREERGGEEDRRGERGRGGEEERREERGGEEEKR